MILHSEEWNRFIVRGIQIDGGIKLDGEGVVSNRLVRRLATQFTRKSRDESVLREVSQSTNTSRQEFTVVPMKKPPSRKNSAALRKNRSADARLPNE